ncbi:aminopeptidase P N-terminal domain-containing protein [Erysipelothrix sp. D19-032]
MQQGFKNRRSVVVFDKTTQDVTLFLREIDPNMEKWVGHYMTEEEAQLISGIEDIRYFDEFDAFVNSVMERDVQIGLDFDHDTITEEFHGSGLAFVDFVGEDRVVNIFEELVRLRMVKLP